MDRRGSKLDQLVTLLPVVLAVAAGIALMVALPGRIDPATFVARIMVILAGSAVVLVTADRLVPRRRPHALSALRPEANRWRARPVQAGALRAVTILVPIAAVLGVTLLLDGVLPEARTGGSLALRLVGLLAVAYLVVYLVERALRRLGPLAMLLKLNMAFPGPAPSRFKVARTSGKPRVLQERLEEALRRRDVEVAEVAATILSLVAALTSHDRRTRGHSERVRAFTDMLAEQLRLPEESRDRLRWTALLHDIGKLTISPRILNKPGPLDGKQREIMNRHPAEGARIVAPLAPWLGEWATSIAQHHEHWDGTGYPAGLTGEELQLGARVISVADAYDTMTAPRPYRAAMTPAAAREEIARCAGSHFDPLVARALLNIGIRRLWWRIGIAGWFAQLPLLGRIPQVAAPASQAAAAGVRTAAVVAGVATVATIPAAGQTSPVHGSRAETTVAIDSASERSAKTAGEAERHGSGDRDGRKSEHGDKAGSGGRGGGDDAPEGGGAGGTSTETSSGGSGGGGTTGGSGGASGGASGQSGSGDAGAGAGGDVLPSADVGGLGPPWNKGGGTGWGGGNGGNKGQGAENASDAADGAD